eukprot:14905128-Alexandrium_andersonii.AAC.1
MSALPPRAHGACTHDERHRTDRRGPLCRALPRAAHVRCPCLQHAHTEPMRLICRGCVRVGHGVQQPETDASANG